MFRNRNSLLILGLITSCATPSHWELKSVGEGLFHSSRMRYVPQDALGGVVLEFVEANGEIAAYATSLSRRLGKEHGRVTARLDLGEEILEEALPLHEGRMRMRLPDEWAKKAYLSLLEGHEIHMMIGETVQTIEPEKFSAMTKTWTINEPT